jgi:hypothetical protein
VPLTGHYALPTGSYLPRAAVPDFQPGKKGGKVVTVMLTFREVRRG